MTATAFNPLATARELKDAGLATEHAEAIAEGMLKAVDAAADAALATKGDLAELRAGLGDLDNQLRVNVATKADLTALENRLRADLATKADLETLRSELRWMLAFQAAIILAIAAKLFGIV